LRSLIVFKEQILINSRTLFSWVRDEVSGGSTITLVGSSRSQVFLLVGGIVHFFHLAEVSDSVKGVKGPGSEYYR
jgi:hypothetical protein